MTPTLVGRWQTRLFLFPTVGLLVSLLFAELYADYRTVFTLLATVLIVGLLLDIPYDLLQYLRWDSDWSPLLVVLTAIVEGGIVWLLATGQVLPGVDPNLTFDRFLAHYVSVFIAIFVMLFGGLRILFPRWRYNGGAVGMGLALPLLIIFAVVVFGGVFLLIDAATPNVLLIPVITP